MIGNGLTASGEYTNIAENLRESESKELNEILSTFFQDFPLSPQQAENTSDGVVQDTPIVTVPNHFMSRPREQTFEETKASKKAKMPQPSEHPIAFLVKRAAALAANNDAERGFYSQDAIDEFAKLYGVYGFEQEYRNTYAVQYNARKIELAMQEHAPQIDMSFVQRLKQI